ncbi:hypothetical protein [Coraliomargarita algicola]
MSALAGGVVFLRRNRRKNNHK